MSSQQDEYELIGLRFEAAIYRLGRRMHPSNARILDAHAGALSALGDYREALAAVDELLRLEPDSPRVLYNRACILSRLGRVEDAMDTLELAVSQGFDDFDHMTNDPDLRPLRSRPEFRIYRARALAQYTRRVVSPD